MPFVPHNRITLSGTLGGAQTTGAGAPEAFSYGINLVTPGGLIITTDQGSSATLADLVADCVAFHGRAGSAIALNAVLKTVKVATIGADGKYLSDPFIAEVSQPGGSASNQVYPQLALAVSLGTERRGASGRGRFFLPMPILTGNPVSFLLESPGVLGVRNSAAIFVDDLNNLPGFDTTGTHVAVISVKGFSSRVTAVRVGRVVDTMRSRRRQLDENYTPDAVIFS